MKSTQVFAVDAHAPDAGVIAQAASVLCEGGLVAFPTETVYGLGANALDADAVRGIFEAKQRPAYDPLIVHLAGVEALDAVAREVPSLVAELAAHFWPGPLTLVVPKAPRVPANVTAGGDTVAVRVPAHPVALALLRAADVPIAAPSANRFGHLSPTRADHVLADLRGVIDVVLDGGPTPVGVESTVLSLVTPEPTILRPGGVSREALEAVLGAVQLRERVVVPTEEIVPSPGTLSQHYAPHADLTLYRGERATVLAAMREAAQAFQQQGHDVGVLVAAEDGDVFAEDVTVQTVGTETNLAVVAQSLFAALHALEAAGVSIILARDFGTAGFGLAIRDRLTRAAGGRIIDIG